MVAAVDGDCGAGAGAVADEDGGVVAGEVVDDGVGDGVAVDGVAAGGAAVVVVVDDEDNAEGVEVGIAAIEDNVLQVPGEPEE